MNFFLKDKRLRINREYFDLIKTMERRKNKKKKKNGSVNKIYITSRSLDIGGLGGDSLLVLFVLLGVQEFDEIWEWDAGALDVLGVVFLHDVNLNTHDTLLQHDVSDGGFEVVLLCVTG